MSLTGVKISEEVWLTCVTHALSTETEEVMGLLLGDIEYLDNGYTTALVWGAAPQTRSDRRKDRVETNPEQLAAASAEAERISADTGRITRVIGWYHSHPHITVLPSHVDVRTQGMYQLMEPGFVGLIFSCFSEDANKVGRIQATAFQASNGRQKEVMRVPTIGKNLRESSGDMEVGRALAPSISVSSSSHSESAELEIINPQGSNGLNSHDAALEEIFANTSSDAVSSRGKTNTNFPGLWDTAGKKTVDGGYDSFDLTDGMQEAMHRSNLDMSGAEFTRKEVPLQVVPGYLLTKVEFPLSSLVSLQKILFDEEQTAYNLALSQSMRKGKIHPLTLIHHSATYQASLCKLMEYCLSPVLSSLWDRLQQNKSRLALLQEEANNLQLQRLTRSNRMSHTQRRTSGGVVRGNTYSSSPEKRLAGDLSSLKNEQKG